MRNSPGAKYQAPGWPLTMATSNRQTGDGRHEATHNQRLLLQQLQPGSQAVSDDNKMPTVAAVKITPVWMAL